jgi:hypothetical protein
MKKMNYHWTKNQKGQFVDGHERANVVAYRQNVFLLAWAKVKRKTQDWTGRDQPDPLPHKCHVIVWFHDESMFYANDR